jgi:phage terminase small subunit
MPVLSNHRHEQFAQALVSGRLNATQAYVSAGYSGKGAAVSASRLRRKANVAARIQELQSKAAEDFMEKLLSQFTR